MCRATRSLPTPLSPVMRTLPSEAATRAAVARSAAICGLTTMNELELDASTAGHKRSPDIFNHRWLIQRVLNGSLAPKCRQKGSKQYCIRIWINILDGKLTHQRLTG